MSPLQPHPTLDPNTVYGLRSIYRAVSVEDVDKALTIIARRIRLSSIPDLIEMLREDANRLLDRRWFLAWPVTEEA